MYFYVCMHKHTLVDVSKQTFNKKTSCITSQVAKLEIKVNNLQSLIYSELYH